MEPHSSILAWKIPWMEEPGRLQSMGSGRVGHDWATSLSVFTFMHWRSKWQPTPVFLPGESQGWRSLVGCRLWGCTESDTTEVTSQANKFKKGIVRIRKDLSTYTVWSHMCKPGRWNVLSFSFSFYMCNRIQNNRIAGCFRRNISKFRLLETFSLVK